MRSHSRLFSQALALVACLAFLVSSSFSIAAPLSPAALTLDQAISEGLLHSPSIQRQQALLGESQWRKNEMLGSGFLPKIAVNAYRYFGQKYQFTDIEFGGTLLSFPNIFPTTQLTLDAKIPIFDGLSNIRHFEAASLALEASEHELSRSEFQLTQDIRLAYYQAVAASELDAVAEQNVRTLEDHLKEVEIQKRGGSATNYDTLRVSVQLSEARADAIDAADIVVLSRKKLTQLMGLENDERSLAGVLPEPDSKTARLLEISGVPVDRNDILALEKRAESAEKIQSADNSWLMPSIAIGGQFLVYDQLLYNNALIDNQKYETAYNVGVFLSWNLFDGGVSYDRARQSEYRQTQAERTAQEAKLQIPYDFEFWKKRFLSNTDHYQARRRDVERSEESVRLAKEEEKAGTRTSSETLDAELDLFRAKAGVVNAQLNAAEAQIRLELALGRRI